MEKQKAGKKKMRQFGKVEVPQEAFIAALKMDAPIIGVIVYGMVIFGFRGRLNPGKKYHRNRPSVRIDIVLSRHQPSG